MKVAHPHADRDASPAAVTVGTDTYPVDEDGIIQCPADRAAEVADVLARAHDVPPDGLLTREDEPPDDGLTLDPRELTVSELRKELAAISDTVILRNAREIETDNDDRTTALEAINARLNELND